MKMKLYYSIFNQKGLKFFRSTAAAILDKKLKTFIFIYFNVSSSFLRKISLFNIQLGCYFPVIPNLFHFTKKLRYSGSKNWCKEKNRILITNLKFSFIKTIFCHESRVC